MVLLSMSSSSRTPSSQLLLLLLLAPICVWLGGVKWYGTCTSRFLPNIYKLCLHVPHMQNAKKKVRFEM